LIARGPADVCFIPNVLRALDPNEIILGSIAFFSLMIDGAKVPLVDVAGLNRPLLFPTVARLPRWQSKPGTHMLTALAPIIVGMRMNQKSVGRLIAETDCEGAISRRMSRAGRQDLMTRNFATESASD